MSDQNDKTTEKTQAEKKAPPPKEKPVELELHHVDLRTKVPCVDHRTSLVAVPGSMALHLVVHAGSLAVRVDRGAQHPVAYVPLHEISGYVTSQDQRDLTERRAAHDLELAKNAADQRKQAKEAALAKERAARGNQDS